MKKISEFLSFGGEIFNIFEYACFRNVIVAFPAYFHLYFLNKLERGVKHQVIIIIAINKS